MIDWSANIVNEKVSIYLVNTTFLASISSKKSIMLSTQSVDADITG
jgi:hypothetical protein